MVIGEINISPLLKLFEGTLGSISITFFLSHLGVGVLHRLLHIEAGLCVLIVSLSEDIIEVKGLCVVSLLSESLLILEGLFLSNLLFNPVTLL